MDVHVHRFALGPRVKARPRGYSRNIHPSKNICLSEEGNIWNSTKNTVTRTGIVMVAKEIRCAESAGSPKRFGQSAISQEGREK